MSETQPTTIILFGATGDLARNKLISAMYDLYIKKYMPETFRILGFSRKPLTDEQYQDFVREALEKKNHDMSSDMAQKFISLFSYTSGDITDLATYTQLAKDLSEHDRQQGMCSNKLFYLAVSPKLYEPVCTYIAESGLHMPCADGTEGSATMWTRILVEKPFGEDLNHAQKLDALLGKLYTEDQIFRIDHYLAKETVQNILSFRFANSVFEPLWNKDHIESVAIRFYEKDTVESRGAFFDGIGLLRDVGQNHMLQMLALVAMEDPGALDSHKIRSARAQVFTDLQQLCPDMMECISRGQYVGYRDIEGVDPASDTETFFRIGLHIANERWNGTPFYLEAGKALDQEKMEIVITFKEKESCVCPEHDEHASHKNVLTIAIQPNPGISIRFWAKRPGFEYKLDPKDLSFDYQPDTTIALPDAYERVLYDAIRGDQTLFTTTDEVIAEWDLIAPILEHWHTVPLIEYPQGASVYDIIEK